MHALADFFSHLVQHAGYAGLFAAMALANVGAPVGSEIVLPLAGGMAAKGLLSSVWLAIAVAVLAELTGQTVGYAIGRFGGRPFVDRYGKYIHFHHAELDKAHRFFDRYGKFAIFICRFIPFRSARVCPRPFTARFILFCWSFSTLRSCFWRCLSSCIPELPFWAALGRDGARPSTQRENRKTASVLTSDLRKGLTGKLIIELFCSAESVFAINESNNQRQWLRSAILTCNWLLTISSRSEHHG